MIKRGLASGIIILLVSTTLVSSVNSEVDVQSSSMIKHIYSIGGNHPPIYIEGNDNFTSENGVTRGSGTEEDPYIIENWIIVGDGSAEDGIFINNTDAHFIIRNCTIYGFHHPDEYYCGITFGNVENGNVERSTLYANHDGIGIRYSSNIRIDNCSCYDYPFLNANGISCYHSTFITITSFECYNMYIGVRASHCSDITIQDSKIHHNTYVGIDFFGDSKADNLRINVINCSIYNNQHYGIWFEDRVRHPSHSIITCCEIYNNGDSYQGQGICIQKISNTIIEHCSIYSNNAGGIILDSSNNIVRNCSIFNHSSDTQPQLTAGITITGWMRFLEMSWNNTIMNCDIYNNELGIDLDATFGVTVEKNNIINNSWTGVLSWQFVVGKISNNNFVHNGFHMPENNTCCVTAIRSFLDMRNNWWDAEDGPKAYICGLKNIIPIRSGGSGETILCLRIPVLYLPWASEPIPDSGVNT
jgi:parallel beta-helix repeat protein